MKPTPFGTLVASEAAVRMESVYRRGYVVLDQKQEHPTPGAERKRVEYDVRNPDAGNNPEEIGGRLYETFLRLYDFAYQDSSQHHKSANRNEYCNTEYLPREDHEQLRVIFNKFAAKAYTPEGQLKLSFDDGPGALKDLYLEIGRVPLHATGLATGALFVELGRGDKWKKLFPNGVDFARGDPEAKLDIRFLNAFFGKEQTPESETYVPHKESYTEIENIRFPVVMEHFDTWPKDRQYLVTQTGHLVDLTNEVRSKISNYIKSRKPLNRLQVEIKDEDYLLKSMNTLDPDFAKLPNETRKIILDMRKKIAQMASTGMVDGMQMKHHRRTLTAPLMSMDVDVMTGLTMKPMDGNPSELEQLQDFLKGHNIKKFSDLVPEKFVRKQHNILASSSDPQAQEKMLGELRRHIKHEMEELEKKAASNSNMFGIIHRASTQLQVMLPRAYESADSAFLYEDQGRKRVRPPAEPGKQHMYMSMGGSGSGKGGLKAIAKRECDDGKSLVTASLDDVRGESDRYWLYIATNNHNNDYKAVEQYARTIQDIVSRRALGGNYNLFIDGSGIPYEDRNDKVVKQFKQNGYHVSVLGAQVPLYVGDTKKRAELSADNDQAPDDALLRSGERLSKHLRGVPIPVTVDKHIRFTLASRNAARDPNVDRFMINDVSAEKGQDYTLSYVLPKVDERTLSELVPANGPALTGEKLRHKLDELGLMPVLDSGKERSFVKPPKDAHLYNLKVIRDNSVDDPSDRTYRVEVITDIDQYTAMVQKGLYNRETKGPDELFKNTLHADVEEIFKDRGGRLNFTHSKGVAAAPYPKASYIDVIDKGNAVSGNRLSR